MQRTRVLGGCSRMAAAGGVAVTVLVCMCVSRVSSASAFGVAKWEAGTCKIESCNIEGKSPGAEFYTQAAGHPNFGITDFAFDYKTAALTGAKEPEGHVYDVRVDLPPGLATNPEAVQQCPEATIEEFKCPAASQVGEEEAIGTAELTLGLKTTVTERFGVYNVQRRAGEPARFGVEVTSETLALAEMATGHKLQSVIYLDGAISWHREAEDSENAGVASGDYHEFFKITEIPTEPEIVQSKLIFWGVPHEHQAAAADNAFLTMPSSANACSQPQTTWLHVSSHENPGAFTAERTETRLENGTPLTATGCGELAFAPSLALTPGTTQADQPDGAGIDLHVPQTTTEPSKPDSPDVQSVAVALPEGMTLNPSAANGLQACTNAQAGIEGGASTASGTGGSGSAGAGSGSAGAGSGSTSAGSGSTSAGSGSTSGGGGTIASEGPTACPATSQIGTVSVNAPGIPNGALSGAVYVGTQENTSPESGGEYRVFLIAQAPAYGVGLRLEGRVSANAGTGRLTARFTDAPQVPFEDFTVSMRGGARAPLANPLSCGSAAPVGSVAPYSGETPAAAADSGFTVSGASGGVCTGSPPFALSQSTSVSPARAGATGATFTFNLARGDGEQYLGQVRTVLAPGLVGMIPAVGLCGEPQANGGSCGTGSRIGTASVGAGAGSEPYAFSGAVYLTGPYGGSPYGLSIVVPAVAGPFNLGVVVARAGVGVEPYSGRVVVSAPVPAIEGGVPLRLKTLSVTVNRPGFLVNPTSCGPLVNESTLTSTFGALQALASGVQMGECNKLAFAPKLSAYSHAHPTRTGGASLEVTVTQPAGQANISELQMQLPKQLPARQTTLKKACLAASFEAGGNPPGECTARVGSASVSTPVLPGKLTGNAYLVSHGGAAFPDLDLVLAGDGVKVVLVGHTHISTKGITSSTFEDLPDVPVSSVTVSLPVGPQSVLGANGSLCKAKLSAPTTIVAQDGAKLTPHTVIVVRGCPAARGCQSATANKHKQHPHHKRRAAATGKNRRAAATGKNRRAAATGMNRPGRHGSRARRTLMAAALARSDPGQTQPAGDPIGNRSSSTQPAGQASSWSASSASSASQSKQGSRKQAHRRRPAQQCRSHAVRKRSSRHAARGRALRHG